MTSAIEPCPVCGQAVHPLAGRCKRCKADLVAIRERASERATSGDAGHSPVSAGSREVAGVGEALATEASPAPRVSRGEDARSAWSRQWPLAVALLAVFGVGVAAGMMLERWLSQRDDAVPGTVHPSEHRTPRMVPDHMPAPPPPAP